MNTDVIAERHLARLLRQTESKDLRLPFASYATSFGDTTLEQVSTNLPRPIHRAAIIAQWVGKQDPHPATTGPHARAQGQL